MSDDNIPTKTRTYRSKNFGKKDIEIARALMREHDPDNTLASAKWGQGFREEKDKVRPGRQVAKNRLQSDFFLFSLYDFGSDLQYSNCFRFQILTEIYTRFCKQSPTLSTKDQVRARTEK